MWRHHDVAHIEVQTLGEILADTVESLIAFLSHDRIFGFLGFLEKKSSRVCRYLCWFHSFHFLLDRVFLYPSVSSLYIDHALKCSLRLLLLLFRLRFAASAILFSSFFFFLLVCVQVSCWLLVSFNFTVPQQLSPISLASVLFQNEEPKSN